mmetsp:Transcript_19394/g.37439  ORF Transcript_19394/g.37439 Transcript_19394/m.37439 type:complete len:378 (-) Transcript_19394:294-1427(-)
MRYLSISGPTRWIYVSGAHAQSFGFHIHFEPGVPRELCALLDVVRSRKPQLIRHKAESQLGGMIISLAHCGQSITAHIIYKAVQQERTHSRRDLVKRKEAFIVVKPYTPANLQHVGEILMQAHIQWNVSELSQHVPLGDQGVEHAVRGKLVLVPRHSRSVQRAQRRLALVELGVVLRLQGDARVRLVHPHRQLVADVLHCQVLPDGFELVAGVRVVRRLPPAALHQLQACLQHPRRPHARALRGRGEPQVLLLQRLRRAHRGSVAVPQLLQRGRALRGSLVARLEAVCARLPPQELATASWFQAQAHAHCPSRAHCPARRRVRRRWLGSLLRLRTPAQLLRLGKKLLELLLGFCLLHRAKATRQRLGKFLKFLGGLS